MARAKYFESLGIGASPLTPSFADVVATSVIPFVAVGVVAIVTLGALPLASEHDRVRGAARAMPILAVLLGCGLMLVSLVLDALVMLLTVLLNALVVLIAGMLVWMLRQRQQAQRLYLPRAPIDTSYGGLLVAAVALVTFLLLLILALVTSSEAIWIRRWLAVLGFGIALGSVALASLGRPADGGWRDHAGGDWWLAPVGVGVVIGTGVLFGFAERGVAEEAARFQHSFVGHPLREVHVKGHGAAPLPHPLGCILEAGDGRVLLITWITTDEAKELSVPQMWGVDISNATITPFTKEDTAEDRTDKCTLNQRAESSEAPTSGSSNEGTGSPLGFEGDAGEASDAPIDPVGEPSIRGDGGSQPPRAYGPDPVDEPLPPDRTSVPYGGAPVLTPTSTPTPTATTPPPTAVPAPTEPSPPGQWAPKAS